MPSMEDLWQAFTSARDNFYTAQTRYTQLIEDGVDGFVLTDARADLDVADLVYQETAFAWLAAHRGDAA